LPVSWAARGLHGQKLEAQLILFQKLWEPLFTRAIGDLLMAAAVLQRGAWGGGQRGARQDSG